jgi:hypothetical protein
MVRWAKARVRTANFTSLESTRKLGRSIQSWNPRRRWDRAGRKASWVNRVNLVQVSSIDCQ